MPSRLYVLASAPSGVFARYPEVFPGPAGDMRLLGVATLVLLIGVAGIIGLRRLY